MKTKTLFVIQILLGLIFFVFGLNGFLQFMPQPVPPEGAMKFLGGLMAAPYFFPLLKGTEVLIGLALLVNRFVPLALVILAPIMLQIFLYHTILDPSGAPMVIVLMTLLLVSAWGRKESYAELMKAK